jgi:hypothetical protein
MSPLGAGAGEKVICPHHVYPTVGLYTYTHTYYLYTHVIYFSSLLLVLSFSRSGCGREHYNLISRL